MILMHEVHVLILSSHDQQARFLAVKSKTHYNHERKLKHHDAPHKNSSSSKHAIKRRLKRTKSKQRSISKSHKSNLEKHRKLSKNHSKKLHKSKNRALRLPFLGYDYASELGSLEKSSDYSTSNTIVTMLFLFIMISMLGRSFRGSGKTTTKMRKLQLGGLSNLLGGGGVLSLLTGGVDISSLIKKEKESFKIYLKEQKIEVTPKTPWESITDVVKTYCQNKYGISGVVYNQFQPMVKKVYVSYMEKKQAKLDAAAAAEGKSPDIKTDKDATTSRRLKKHKKSQSKKEKKSKKSHKKSEKKNEDLENEDD